MSQEIRLDWPARVAEWNRRAGVEQFAQLGGEELQQAMDLALRLVDEETTETAEALRHGHRELLADGIADSIFVLLGLAYRAGIDMVPVFAEVCDSNDTKLVGKERRQDGKVGKGAYYRAPAIAAALAMGRHWRKP